MSVTEARRLRRKMTPPELRLWQVLRRRPGGFQFRRQYACNPYVFDFFCIPAALAIEIDGMAHSMGRNPARDAVRDLWADAEGIRTLRIAAPHVRDNLDGVVAHIVLACEERTPPPASPVPLPVKTRGGKHGDCDEGAFC